ncbi:MAG: GNAT family N-acetyltransferase, partial [Anaerolineae bacterium]|nr:GNAT family N-acetyltransferase [Anaerolineae bacterium]
GLEHFNGVNVQPMVKLDGYELIIGSSVDPQFGPVILFGTGGSLVEVYKDRSLALPPLTTTLARRLIERTKIYEALKGVRGRQAVNLAELEKLLVRFSQIVAEQRLIAEIDINPLIASPDRLLALDARVVLHPADVTKADLPKLAIRPYPKQYVHEAKANDGTALTIRPIRPEDEPLMIKFHETLSERTVYMRFFTPFQLQERIAHERLSKICFIDYAREMIFVATRKHPKSHETEIMATMRLTPDPDGDLEFGLLVSDKFQGQGLGKQLLQHAIDFAKQEGYPSIFGVILPENTNMLHLAQELGFTMNTMDDKSVVAVMTL